MFDRIQNSILFFTNVIVTKFAGSQTKKHRCILLHDVFLIRLLTLCPQFQPFHDQFLR